MVWFEKPSFIQYEKWTFLWLPKSRDVGNRVQWCWLEWALVEYTYAHDIDGPFWSYKIVRLKRDVLSA
jgi:hypothetical protein